MLYLLSIQSIQGVTFSTFEYPFDFPIVLWEKSAPNYLYEGCLNLIGGAAQIKGFLT